MWTLLCFMLLYFFSPNAGEEVAVVVNADATLPITARSPPEGNTTFLDDTTWCVARPGASEIDLQTALDWACGVGEADCSAIQHGRECYEPATIVSHASYAFNSYYQTNGNNDVACYFGGTAALTKRDPSYGKCSYATSKSLAASSANALSEYRRQWLRLIWVVGSMLLLLLHLGR